MNHPLNTVIKKNIPYGTWPSAITAELIVSDSISLDETILSSKSTYYIERRPQENGRCVIIKITDDETIDLLPAPFSARSRVHEYGGGSYCVCDELLFFVNDRDQDIYLVSNGQITRLTQAENKYFADFIYDKKQQRLIAICESHETTWS